MLCFANSREARSVGSDPGKAINTFIFLSISELLTSFSIKGKTTSPLTCFTFSELELL